MEAINIPSVKLEKEEGNNAIFVIEPFYPGYGTTIGNALRRVLLTSLPGTAVTAFRIIGADHEFTTIDGIKEDVTEIMLNVKGLRFALHEAGPVTVKLKAKKSGPVTGKDIEASSSVELVNPDHHIATISGKANLEMEIQIEHGRGYVLSEEMDSKGFAIGTIAIDAVFSPVKRCSIKVQNTRVGDRVDYDKLTLELETDGTITPKDTLQQASEILTNQLGIFAEEDSKAIEAKAKKEKTAEEAPADDKKKDSDPKNFSIEEINLSLRTTNALNLNSIKKIKDILAVGREGLLEMKGVGERAVTEIADKMDELGLEF